MVFSGGMCGFLGGCMVFLGGAWFFRGEGGIHGFLGGYMWFFWGCAWFFQGGMHGGDRKLGGPPLHQPNDQSVCVSTLSTLRGACMVFPGGMCGFFGGACVVFSGGMCGFFGGVCMVFSGGMHGFFGGGCVGLDEIRSMSGWYASYWNALLFMMCFLFFRLIEFWFRFLIVVLQNGAGRRTFWQIFRQLK